MTRPIALDQAPRVTRTPSVLKGKRIIFVLGDLELGGAERQAMILARPTGDAEALAAKILKLADDPIPCAAIGVENRERIAERFNSARMFEETVSLLVNISA